MHVICQERLRLSRRVPLDGHCTVAGMIMEDHNLMAVSKSKDVDDRAARLAALTMAGSNISKLIAAAEVLVRLG